MRRRSLASELRAQAEERREWAEAQPVPWWVRLSPPSRGIFAAERDLVALARTLYGMRESFEVAPTDRSDVRYVSWGEREVVVADERDMPALMRCLRMSGLHGTVRRAGTDKTYTF